MEHQDDPTVAGVGAMFFVGILGIAVLALLIAWLILERGRLLQSSTRELAKINGGINLRTLHGIFYYRWYERYVKLALRYARIPRIRDWIVSTYHSKVITPDLARAIVTVNHQIPLQDLEQIVPYATARSLMLSASPDIAVTECPCRNIRQNPCRPTQVCMVIGQPMVDFVMQHRPRESRRISQEEALQLLKSEHDRGHMHSAWFKDALGGRFFAICNCCKCCCGALEVMNKHNADFFAPSGYVARIAPDDCTACGACASACPFDAISMNEGAVLDFSRCRGCGVCVSACGGGAIELVRDDRKGIPLDVRNVKS